MVQPSVTGAASWTGFGLRVDGVTEPLALGSALLAVPMAQCAVHTCCARSPHVQSGGQRRVRVGPTLKKLGVGGRSRGRNIWGGLCDALKSRYVSSCLRASRCKMRTSFAACWWGVASTCVKGVGPCQPRFLPFFLQASLYFNATQLNFTGVSS